MLKTLQYIEKPYEKNYFSASDFDKWDLELYLGLSHVSQTNPKDVTSLLRMTTGSAIEEAILSVYKMNGIVDEYYDQDFDGRVEFEREGLEIHGYMDAVTKPNTHGLKPGCPIEIKTINNNNSFDVRDYTMGRPRYNYVGQLAVYMDFLNVDTGYLQVATIDGLQDFFFTCTHEGNGVYKCGDTIVNVRKEYERWAAIQRMVESKTMPNLFTYRYKYSLEDIDWRSLSQSKISKARGGTVLGDWQVVYSPWKDLIIKLQGDTLGYSEEELAYIKKQTEGYTTWKKK